MQIIDASDSIMGRLASHVAKLLLETEKESEPPMIHVVNAERVLITGSTSTVVAKYRRLREQIGSSRKGPYFPRMPHMIMKRAIRGMLPYQKPRGRSAYKRLRVHIGVPEELAKESQQVVESARKPGISRVVRLEEVSRTLGAKF